MNPAFFISINTIRHYVSAEIQNDPLYGPKSNGMAESFVKTFRLDNVQINNLHDKKNVKKRQTRHTKARLEFPNGNFFMIKAEDFNY